RRYERQMQRLLPVVGEQRQDARLLPRVGDTVDDPAFLAGFERKLVLKDEPEVVARLAAPVAGLEVITDDAVEGEGVGCNRERVGRPGTAQGVFVGAVCTGHPRRPPYSC